MEGQGLGKIWDDIFFDWDKSDERQRGHRRCRLPEENKIIVLKKITFVTEAGHFTP